MRSILLLCLVACSDTTEPPGAGVTPKESIEIATSCTPATPVATTTVVDESYGSDPQQRFDLARPSAPGSYPLVALIHGGGWSAGSKAELRDLMLYVAGQGYVAASLDYRLVAGTTNTFPTGVQDVRCALRTLVDRATMHEIDAQRVVVFGFSAGAHLAALLGVASDVAAFDGPCDAVAPTVQVDGVASFAGPMDLRDPASYPSPTVPIITAFLGTDADPALASPITHLDPSDPPFLLVHGTIDDVVPVAESQTMQEELWRAEVAATLVTGVFGHTSPQPSQADSITIACTTDAFFKTYTR